MAEIGDYLHLIEIPKKEKIEFEVLIKQFRKKYITRAHDVVEKYFSQNPQIQNELCLKKKASLLIENARGEAYKYFLTEEAEFNAQILKAVTHQLETPSKIADKLISERIISKEGQDLLNAVKDVCGEYAGRISPYIYQLSLSNTQSRRSRAGKTFEAVIYQIYKYLDYPFDSQSKVGRETFSRHGLGKKVDSILPGIEQFEKNRTKVIIGTMKTTLRERWQEVAEEIERTKVPSIYLLTADDVISRSKAAEMGKHNIIVVTYESVKEQPELKDIHTIVSFETYLFKEIPQILNYWNDKL